MEPVDRGEVTQLLGQLEKGDSSAVGRLMPLMYRELRELAGRCMRRESPGHTLQPTALVHEAYLRLVDQREAKWQNRAHFLSVAALVMRRILTSYARRRTAGKRGGHAEWVTLEEGMAVSEQSLHEVLAVDEALTRLCELDATQARVVELRYFGGLSVEETAQVLELSAVTVKREWRSAKAWLLRELTRQKSDDSGPLAKSQAAL